MVLEMVPNLRSMIVGLDVICLMEVVGIVEIKGRPQNGDDIDLKFGSRKRLMLLHYVRSVNRSLKRTRNYCQPLNGFENKCEI